MPSNRAYLDPDVVKPAKYIVLAAGGAVDIREYRREGLGSRAAQRLSGRLAGQSIPLLVKGLCCEPHLPWTRGSQPPQVRNLYSCQKYSS